MYNVHPPSSLSGRSNPMKRTFLIEKQALKKASDVKNYTLNQIHRIKTTPALKWKTNCQAIEIRQEFCGYGSGTFWSARIRSYCTGSGSGSGVAGSGSGVAGSGVTGSKSDLWQQNYKNAQWNCYKNLATVSNFPLLKWPRFQARSGSNLKQIILDSQHLSRGTPNVIHME